MSIVVELFIGAVCSYVVYRQESIEKGLAELKKEVAHLTVILPKRRNDRSLD